MKFALRPAAEVQDLSRWSAKARRAAARDTAEIDWRLPVKLPLWLPRGAYVTMVSQLYHGELATLRFCRQLRGKLREPGLRALLDLQIADEDRHAVIYGRYLRRLGGPVPAHPKLARAYASALTWPGPYLGQVIAFHVILEGEALHLQQAFAQFFPCPLLRQINRRVAQDEARHIALGRILLAGGVAALPPQERAEIYRWVKDLWHDCAGAMVTSFPGPLIPASSLARPSLSRRWAAHEKTLRQIGLLPCASAAERRGP